MQFSTKETPKPPGPKLILLQGTYGSGKTALAMQFPGPGFIDCDGNVDGPEEFVRKLKPDLEYGYVQVAYKEGAQVDMKECYNRLMDLIEEFAKEPRIKTIIIDSLLLVNEFIVLAVLKEENTRVIDTLHWNAVKSKYNRLLASKLRGTGKTCIVTVHDKPRYSTEKSDMMKKVIIGYEPNVQSSIRDAFGGLFTDVWCCTQELEPGNKVSFKLQTVRDGKRDLKNSMGMESVFVAKQGELMWSKIEKYFKV